jgi:hypothetical protein
MIHKGYVPLKHNKIWKSVVTCAKNQNTTKDAKRVMKVHYAGQEKGYARNKMKNKK